MWRPWKSPQKQPGQSEGTVYCSKKNNSIQARSKKSVARFWTFQHLSYILQSHLRLGQMYHLFCVTIHSSPNTKKCQNLWHKYFYEIPSEMHSLSNDFCSVFFSLTAFRPSPSAPELMQELPCRQTISAISSSNFYQFIIGYKWIGKRFPNVKLAMGQFLSIRKWIRKKPENIASILVHLKMKWISHLLASGMLS